MERRANGSFSSTFLVENGNVEPVRHGEDVPLGEFQGGLVTQDAEGAVRAETFVVGNLQGLTGGF